MSVRAEDPRLTAYALGELSRDELAEFESLLENDARARACVASIRETSSQLQRELAAPGGEGLSARRRASIFAAIAPNGPVSQVSFGRLAPLHDRSVAPAKRRRAWVLLAAAVLFALALHGGGFPVGVAHSIWRIVDMPIPPLEVMLSRAPRPSPASSLSSAPVPAPAPSAPKRASWRPKPKPLDPVLEARQVDERISGSSEVAEPARESELGEDDARVGEMVGGVVGEAAALPPKHAAPKFLSAQAGHGLLAIDPNERPYKVNVPDEFVLRGEMYSSVLNICVTEQGAVSSVKILEPSIPAIDLQIPFVVPKWRYRPYLVDGKPTAFCYNVKYTVR